MDGEREFRRILSTWGWINLAVGFLFGALFGVSIGIMLLKELYRGF